MHFLLKKICYFSYYEAQIKSLFFVFIKKMNKILNKPLMSIENFINLKIIYYYERK